MSVLTGQIGAASSYLGNMILAAQGCTTDFFDAQLETIDDYSGNMILAVANFCQPINQNTCPLCVAASNTLVITESATRTAIFNRILLNTLVFSETAIRGHVTNNSASNTIVFTTDAEHVKIASASNTITFTNTSTFQGPYKHGENTLNLVQTLVRLFVFNRVISQTLNLASVIEVATVHHLSINNTLLFNQIATRTVKFAEKQISQHLQINQNVEKFKKISANNTIIFSNYAVFKRVRVQSVQQNLSLTQTVSRIVTFNRSVNQTWEVHNGYQRLLPGFGIIENIPAATGIITNCFVLLESLERSIVLPCPRFDDSQEWSSLRVLVKRSILGSTRTYVGRSGLSKIKYTFWLGRQKSLELRQFLLDFIDDDLIMTNFKGEVWLVKFANAMNDFIPKMRYDPQREKVDIVLELEGTKLY